MWGEEAGTGVGGIDIGSKAVLVHPKESPRASVALRFFWNWVEMTGSYEGLWLQERLSLQMRWLQRDWRWLTCPSLIRTSLVVILGPTSPSSTLLREQLFQTLSDSPYSRKEVQFLILQLLWQSSHHPPAICFSKDVPNPPLLSHTPALVFLSN